MENNNIDIKYFIQEDEYEIDENRMLQLIDKYKGKKVKLHNVSKEMVQKLTLDISKKDENYLMYRMIPILANIDMTITEEEFAKAVEEHCPSFTSVFNTIIRHFIKLYKSAEEINSTVNELKSLGLYATESTLEEKTIREKYEEVLKELQITEDLKRYKELLALKEELEKELKEETNE